MKIGFIGVGRMGRPMAERLIAAGHEVLVHNRSQGPVKALVDRGATKAESVAQLASQSGVIMTCLLSPEQMESVYFGPAGVLASGRSGTDCLDFATVDPMLSRRLADAFAERGMSYLDAPISGGPKGATDGTLSIMVGGDKAAYERVKPLLEVMGRKLFYLGESGAGTTAKVCNQLIVGVTHALVAEVMVLGAKAGADPAALYDVLRSSSGQSNSLERAVPNFILPRRFDAAYTITGILKDLDSAMRMARHYGVRELLLPIAQQLYVEAAAQGFGEEDVAGVVRAVERVSGGEVGGS